MRLNRCFTLYLYVHVFLGDGDSSVTKRLNDILPYGPGLRVEKIECRNHMLRNYSQKMSALAKRTEFPIGIRKKISENLVRLRTDITKAIQFRKSEEKPLQLKILGNQYIICILCLYIYI